MVLGAKFGVRLGVAVVAAMLA
ncbi:MAG: hypothetical protein JWO86_1175, partial [Myxococcaceae bacterium]|nr:hypothetical protein [Myxococcaceae bacterium]